MLPVRRMGKRIEGRPRADRAQVLPVPEDNLRVFGNSVLRAAPAEDVTTLVDFDIARKTLGAVRVPITVHTVIPDPNTLDFGYAPGEFLSPPGNRDYVRLPLKNWLLESR